MEQNVVIREKKVLPKHRDECWYLMADLEDTPAQIVNGCAHRMDIKELFRDEKNKLNGWSLRHTRITRADRLDRLLLILALAYILLCGLGLLARSRCRPSCRTASSKNDRSIFTIGRTMLEKLRGTARADFQALIDAIFVTYRSSPSLSRRCRHETGYESDFAMLAARTRVAYPFDQRGRRSTAGRRVRNAQIGVRFPSSPSICRLPVLKA